MKRAEAPSASPRGSPPSALLDWPAEAGVVDLLLGRVEQKVKTRRRRRRVAASSAVAAVTAVLVVFWLIPFLRYTGSFATPVAQRHNVVLADGSQAELNARTILRTDFRAGHRHVWLEQGEAFFSVVKDPTRPFAVETPRGVIHVTGTVFNLRLTADKTEVTLIEGAVTFESRGAGEVKLAPGQQLAANATTTRTQTLSSLDLENVTAWREGRLVLDGLSLSEVAAKLGEYHGVSLTVAPAVANLRPGGTVPLDHLSGVLEALQETLPIRVEREAGAVRLVAR